MTMTSFDYDVLIIGSGFGGSVAALRAAEKGYRAGVMEFQRSRSSSARSLSQPRNPGSCSAAIAPRKRKSGCRPGTTGVRRTVRSGTVMTVNTTYREVPQ
jgi:flavin-dependent dehydrogenase